MSRIQKLAQTLNDTGHDAFLAQTPISMGYLSGFFEDGHERFLTLAIHKSGESRLICPALSQIQAKRIGMSDIRAWRDGENPLEHFEQLSEDWNLRSGVIAIDDHMPAKMLLEMQGVLPAALFKSGGMVIGELMSKKDEAELAFMKRAGQIADETVEVVKANLQEGITELEVREIIETEMKNWGGVPQFCSVCFGPGSAESHHINDRTRLQKDMIVLIDFGCTYEQYCSDITRTMVFGKATEEQKKLYKIVYEAHEAARLLGKVGVKPMDMDQAARSVIEKAGYGEFFTHRTGHGIGMHVHEEPNINSTNDKPLEYGNCFSIEPGIYLEGNCGIRLENLYYATEEGLVSFNKPISPELVEV
jgi:Xaa-Pro dipeptidase